MLRKTLIFGFLLVLGFSFQIDAVDSDNSPKQILLAFKSLENIPADASHGDIATLAKKRFGSHPQVDDWTQLCSGFGVMDTHRSRCSNVSRNCKSRC